MQAYGTVNKVIIQVQFLVTIHLRWSLEEQMKDKEKMKDRLLRRFKIREIYIK